MKCSFKNIRIIISLFTVIMTLVGRGNPETLRNGQWGRRISSVEAEKSPEYVERSLQRNRYGIENTRMRKSVKERINNGQNENQALLEPKIVTKRRKVSLTHFPEGISRRKAEVPFIRPVNIREANYDNTRRRVPTRHLVKARHTKRRNIPNPNYGYYPVDSARVLRNRKKWLLPNGRPDIPEGIQNAILDDVGADGVSMMEQFEPCCKMEQGESAAPQTYMVEVEPAEDGDDGGVSYAAQPQLPLCNKYYYVFERKPFKVKFLNFVSSPGKDCITPVMKFSSNSPLKLSMPAFLCRPPECREVLYCKYFQCTSLGFFPDSRNCRKYFFCDLNSNGFVLYHMLCPKGRIFDPCIRECRLKETMDKRDAERCWTESAKMKRGGKARIKKNESPSQDVIKYKEMGGYERDEKLNELGQKSTVYEFEKINSRHNAKHMSNKKPNHSNDNKMTTTPVCTCQSVNFPTQMIPIPILQTLPKYCETASMPVSTTPNPPLPAGPIVLQKPQPQPSTPQQQPPPPPPPTPPPPATTIPVTTPPPTTTTTTMTIPTTVTITSIAVTAPPVAPTQPTTFPVQIQPQTLPTCPPPPKRKNVNCPKKSLEEYYMGDLDSDAYQDDMLEDEYSDDYYDVPEAEDEQEADYDWLKQGLNDYLEMLKLKSGEKTEADTLKPEIYSGQSTTPLLNDYANNTEAEKQEKTKLLESDADRGKRSEEKTENAMSVEEKEKSGELPDFEKCYNDQKKVNLDGYPCKQYGRYPDKYDSTRYYECGAQPDGNMKIEHKRCPKGEEFSPEYLECVATEYLKVAHRKRRVAESKKPNKQRPTPEPEYNYEDDKEIPNEWLDAPHGNKVPNEFKSKTKHTLRIFHLYCKRNSTEQPQRMKRNREGYYGPDKQRHTARSFTVRQNKKEEQLEDEEDDEYEDDEEDYYDMAEEEGKIEGSTRAGSDPPSATPSSSKVLLDADIRVDKQFEDDLKNILGKKDESERKKDSILITLSGEERGGGGGGERSKRNFLKDLFSKKSSGDDPEKEGVVSMLTLINGLPSEYERDALLQKLERRKMMNSHLYRNRPRTLKKKANSDLDLKIQNTNKLKY